MIDQAAIAEAVTQEVLTTESGKLVSFGIVTSESQTGRSYIEAGQLSGDVHAVASFKEKPG